ncbi:MAG TPA: ABC transporter substrate-binding protein [Hydrogenophaga sp.]|uniref:ABC transporter substrate-binding protein n=1 Tax=Hydrogenophaga sp. TaxID=1904254 RepID=UPI002BD72591|nr:ABC transporter substrate-binding protein [Hydrogenophaga sp.]HMN94117.1 ABC transporter substrate-binding protein [Hydrogenophaga sp.]HMP09069.1 ABC transporter substrate-binding protein [Hydrogenophaga sp.]
MVWLSLLTACAPPPAAPLVLGLGPWIGYDPFILAREERLVDGQRLKLIELSSSTATMRHFRNGLLDLAAMTLDQALQLAAQGMDLRIIAVLNESRGADVVMVSPAMAGLHQLKGQVIVAESSTASVLMLRSLLDVAGLQAGDVQILPMESSQHLGVLQTRRAVAAISYEPMATRLAASGYVRSLDSRQLDARIMRVLVVRHEVLQQRADDVDQVLRVWAAGLRQLEADPQGAALVLAPSLEMASEAYLDAMEGLRQMTPADSLAYLAGVQAPLRQRGQTLAEALMAMGQLTQAPDWNRLVDIGPAGRTQQPGERP